MTSDHTNALTDLSFLGLGDRRVLLKRAASAGLAIPVAGFFGRTTATAQEVTPTPPGGGVGSGRPQEGTGGATPIPAPPATFTPMDPFLPVVQAGPKQIELTAQDATVFVAK